MLGELIRWVFAGGLAVVMLITLLNAPMYGVIAIFVVMGVFAMLWEQRRSEMLLQRSKNRLPPA